MKNMRIKKIKERKGNEKHDKKKNVNNGLQSQQPTPIT